MTLMSESSTGLLLLFVLLIVVAMGVLDRFEAWRLRVPHPRPASHEEAAPNAGRKVAGRTAAVALMAATWALAILAELFTWPAR
jgi:hypothetical protein